MISVIVPVYNVEGYLPRCLDSIVSQTYKDLEIILVDDGSTDSSGKICDEYANKDSRIRVIHQKNSGVSHARNTGLKVVSGEYIVMIDGDDVLHPQMLDTLLRLINSGDYDFSMCFGVPVYDVKDIKWKNEKGTDESCVIGLSSESCMRNLFLGEPRIKSQYHWVWNKMYKRELLFGLFFANTEEEDVEFNNRIYQKINKAIFTQDILYYWVQRKGSISHQGYNMSYVNVLNTYLLCLNEIPEDHKIYRSYCLRRLYRLMLSKSYWSRGSSSHKACKMNCKTILKQTYWEFLRNTFIPIKEKIVLFLFNLCPFFYRIYVKTVNL